MGGVGAFSLMLRWKYILWGVLPSAKRPEGAAALRAAGQATSAAKYILLTSHNVNQIRATNFESAFIDERCTRL